MADIQDKIAKTPDKPGVYIMKDKNNSIIYVGKAVVLKNRVKQYFQNTTAHTLKVRMMVSKIEDIEFIVTDTEMEALILENNLIKEHKPRYNILLKDDKTYPYIKVTLGEDFPRILKTRRFIEDGSRYFGPYSGVGAVNETMWLLGKTFPMKSCKKVFPRDIGKSRPCLNFHISKCMGPCTGEVDAKEYQNMMRDVCDILSGKDSDIVKKLEKQMNEAAASLKFEQAAIFRNRLSSLKQITEKQKVLSTDFEDRDILGYAANETGACINVLVVRNGKLLGSEQFMMDESEAETSELVAAFIKQYYTDAAFIPGELLLTCEIEEINLIAEWLGKKRGSKVMIGVPQRGLKRQLVDMASQNATEALRQKKTCPLAADRSREGLGLLAELLNLPEIPFRVDAFDISNTGNSEITASMVVFENGVPNKKEYRHYRIVSALVQDDYLSMQEVIRRRYSGEKPLPGLVLVDGALGHVNAAKQVLKELGVDLFVAGMVKDDKHRTRGIATVEKIFDITDNKELLIFVTGIQDEAHRFALEYNKKLRKKRYEKSVLDDIPGVGDKRKKALIKYFGSIKAISKAGVDDLSSVPGIGRAAAEMIRSFFGGG